MSGSKWPPEPLHHVQGSYANIECQMMMRYLLEASKRVVFVNPNTAHKTGICLKRRHCVIPVYIFVVRCNRDSISLYTALPREADGIVNELLGNAAANDTAP